MAAPSITIGNSPAAAKRMAEAAHRFLDSLTADQRALAQLPFEGDERYVWNYTPVERNGLPFHAMNEGQRTLAFGLLRSGLSDRGYRDARQIIDLEPILREAERIEKIETQWLRDPERYCFSVFGQPGGDKPWGWRVGGHHVCTHFTTVDSDRVSTSPLFFGANPATVRYGPSTGLRTLGTEEDLGRQVLGGLDAQQRGVAIVDPIAPSDILTKNYRSASPDAAPSGIALRALSGVQRDAVVSLIRHYVHRVEDDLADPVWSRLERAGLDTVTFAWAGPIDRGQKHYYAVKGPTFLIEYDNTQNNGNHIHSVFRDFENDWGEDLLAAHYRDAHHH